MKILLMNYIIYQIQVKDMFVLELIKTFYNSATDNNDTNVI